MKLKIFFFLLFLLLHKFVYAVPGAGSCADKSFKFPRDPKDENIIDTTIPVRTLKEAAPLYIYATGSTQERLSTFDEKFKPLKEQGKRIQVGDQHTAKFLGWMDKQDLLCNFTPLSDAGLPRKAFVKIPTTASTDYFIPSYPSSEEPIFGDKKKIKLKISRFKTFFVFAEDLDRKRFLLSPVYNLAQSESIPLTGWVDIEHIIEWKTNLGIRPKDTTGRVSGYLSLEDSGKTISDRVKGVELTGGKEWYTFLLHLPLLDVIQNHYKVAAPGIGMTGFKPYDSGLPEFNEVDLFFVIDGTASMEPYIKAAQQTVAKIVKRLKVEGRKLELRSDLREANFRCGFLIYRDHYADSEVRCQDGLCEFQYLSAENCKSGNIISCENTIGSLSEVQATTNDNDDYEELLFNALARSVALITPCPDRRKLLVVIGDHGDRENKLSQNVIDNLRELEVVPFFVQTSSNQSKMSNSEKYRIAYNKFRVQTQDILERMAIKDVNDFLISLSANETPNKIATSFLNQHVSPAAITELETILATGESVRNAIEKFRKRPEKGEHGDMSVLFWEMVEKKACEKLPKQCNKVVNHRVNEFFIPVSEGKFVKELLLLERHIQQWRDILKPLINLNKQLSASEKRATLQKLIIEGIQRVLGEPPIEPTDERTLEEIITQLKVSLPIRPQSPLFQYSPYDFDASNENKIPDCEVTRILEWIRSVDHILDKIVEYPKNEVFVDFEEYRDTACPLSEKGKRIKKVETNETSEPLGPDDNYRYGHAVFDVTLYWIPLEYLP